MLRFDGQRGEILATDGQRFSFHRTGCDDAIVPEPGAAVTFFPDGARWPRARAVRRLLPAGPGADA